MTAAVLHGSEDLKIERVPIPKIGTDELLVRVKVALTCGTDLKVWKQGYHARMIKPPAIFGHELAGIVEEAGAACVLCGYADCPAALQFHHVDPSQSRSR